jgi:hypothetical protein
MHYNPETDEYLTDDAFAQHEKDNRRIANAERHRKEQEDRRARKLAVREHRKEVEAKAIGTQEGNRTRMAMFKEKLLSGTNGERVISKILSIAMNDEHPGQMSALKLCADRIIPVSMFEEQKEQLASMNAIAPLLLTQALSLLRDTARKEVVIEHIVNCEVET